MAPDWILAGNVVAVSGAAGGAGGLTAQLARRAAVPLSPGDPGVWTAAVRNRTTAVQAGNCYFFFLPLLLFFLPFLPFLAMPSPRFPTYLVNEMLTRRVNVSLTGGDCRLR